MQAAESALIPTSGAFLKAYRNNRTEGAAEEIDNSPVGTAILQLSQKVADWTGTPPELKKQLEELDGEEVTHKKTWP